MDTLTIRAYNVEFGDAFLISVPDSKSDGQPIIRYILIDVGNVLFKSKGGGDEVFGDFVEDILNVLNGSPLDLYIMTHEHLDHVQGLNYAEEKIYLNDAVELCNRLQTKYVWMTASAAPDYYDNYPEAKEYHLRFEKLYSNIDNYLSSLRASGVPTSDKIKSMRLNNNPRSTKECIKYLRSLTDSSKISYIHRKTNLNGRHPFNDTQFEIWAPEEDTSVYYGRYYPASESLYFTRKLRANNKLSGRIKVVPPHGVDAGDFYNLVEMRQRVYENLLTIDKAKNNTSIVFCLTWRGLRFLFTGDAEERSWLTMRDLKQEEQVLKAVHFIKISHHGSKNGTPEEEILNIILPENPSDRIPRDALLSTREDTYNDVPHESTVDFYRNRCDTLHDLQEKLPGEYIDIKFQVRPNI